MGSERPRGNATGNQAGLCRSVTQPELEQDVTIDSKSSHPKEPRGGRKVQHRDHDIALSEQTKRPPSREGSGTSRPLKVPRLRVTKQSDKHVIATIDATSMADDEVVVQNPSLNILRQTMCTRRGFGNRKPKRNWVTKPIKIPTEAQLSDHRFDLFSTREDVAWMDQLCEWRRDLRGAERTPYGGPGSVTRYHVARITDPTSTERWERLSQWVGSQEGTAPKAGFWCITGSLHLDDDDNNHLEIHREKHQTCRSRAIHDCHEIHIEISGSLSGCDGYYVPLRSVMARLVALLIYRYIHAPRHDETR